MLDNNNLAQSRSSVKDFCILGKRLVLTPLAVMSVNRAVKRARVVQQPPMMMMPQQPMFQQPMFQPVMQQVMVPGQGAVIEEDFDDPPAEVDANAASSRSGRAAPPAPGSSYEKGKSAEIPRSVTYIFKLPRARLSEACEELNEVLQVYG